MIDVGQCFHFSMELCYKVQCKHHCDHEVYFDIVCANISSDCIMFKIPLCLKSTNKSSTYKLLAQVPLTPQKSNNNKKDCQIDKHCFIHNLPLCSLLSRSKLVRVASAPGYPSCFECRFRNVQIPPSRYSRRKTYRHNSVFHAERLAI